MFCRNCGKELTGTPEICLGCGARPNTGSNYCWACGAQTAPVAEMCGRCGARQSPAMAPTPPPTRSGVGGLAGQLGSAQLGATALNSAKSRLVATLLAWFLGPFGAHRFYLGKMPTAIAMLVPGILGWVFVGAEEPEIGLVFLVPVWIWTLVDFAIAVSGNMKDKGGMPIKRW